LEERTSGEIAFRSAGKTFDSVAMMRCLLMLQILIGALQANLEARQRPPNARGESASMYLCLVSLVRHLVRQRFHVGDTLF